MDKKTGETLAEMREAFLTDAENLWNLHQQRFEPLLEASLKRKLGLSFKATIDMTTSTARLDTEIAYGGEKFKEKVSKTFDDPDQEPLPFDGRRPGTGLPETNGHVEKFESCEGCAKPIPEGQAVTTADDVTVCKACAEALKPTNRVNGNGHHAVQNGKEEKQNGAKPKKPKKGQAKSKAKAERV